MMSAAVGYEAIVHMSADARQWKKDLLRKNGVTVYEYDGDYGAAVAEGRKRSDADPMSYFVDDENSRDLFFGYAVAAFRLKKQLEARGIPVDGDHPLFLYIPCGVGGAPGGITFGAKLLFGDNVHYFFAEPVEAPCMLLGMATGLGNGVSVQDIGPHGQDPRRRLAVGRPSGFVGRVMENLLSGEATVSDARPLRRNAPPSQNREHLYRAQRLRRLRRPPGPLRCPRGPGLPRIPRPSPRLQGSTHIVWATGGRLVPEDVREAYQNTCL